MENRLVNVAFIHFDDEPPDLIVAFAIDVGDGAIENLMLLRTPKFEALLLPGVCSGYV